MTQKSNFAPLNNLYMMASIVGLLISLYYIITPTLNIGQLFLSFFIILFVVELLRKSPSSFAYLITLILGIIGSVIFSLLPLNVGDQHLSWGYTFVIFFGIMFFTSMVSMTKADPNGFVDLETNYPSANKISTKKKRKFMVPK